VPQRTVGCHRRQRTSSVSPTALAGTALSASLIAGVAIGTAAASANGHSMPGAVSRPLDPGIDTDTDGDLMPGKTPAAAPVTSVLSAAVIKLKPRADAQAASPMAASPVAAAWVDPNPTAVVTSCFGQRWGRLHAGVDLAAPDGTPIVAAGAGVVVRAGVAEGYGNAVLIDHGNGYLTHYGHLSKITVTVGQHVAAGQQIGNEGSTGHSTGPHLHFEVHAGFYQNPIEPTEWMHQHGVDIPGCVTLD
jgi:murein DD-endopeptidase MepM/ murein hydrolase activator NlpD